MKRTTLRMAMAIGALAALGLLLGAGCAPGFPDESDFSKEFARGNLIGAVTDAESGAPIAGAVVSTQGKSELSGADGRYDFAADLAQGWSEVVASREGYRPVTKEVEIGYVTFADFSLVRER